MFQYGLFLSVIDLISTLYDKMSKNIDGTLTKT